MDDEIDNDIKLFIFFFCFLLNFSFLLNELVVENIKKA